MVGLLLFLLRIALVAGWVLTSWLLLRSVRGGPRTPVFSFRLQAAMLAGCAAAEALLATLRLGALDGPLPWAFAVWAGWKWIEVPIIAVMAWSTGSLVWLLVRQRHAVIDQALREVGRLRKEVGRDPLTGLFNRKVLDEQLAQLLHTEESIGIIFIDVDDFKAYNDQFGHPAGDQVLVAIARLMQSAVRRSDLVVRYGGEEFAVVLPGAGRPVVWRQAEQIRTAMANEPFANRSITISVGVAAYPYTGRTPSDLLKAADDAMYQAKSAGGNRVRGCDYADEAEGEAQAI